MLVVRLAAAAEARPGAGRSGFVEALVEVVRERSVAPGVSQSVINALSVIGLLSVVSLSAQHGRRTCQLNMGGGPCLRDLRRPVGAANDVGSATGAVS